MRINTTNLVAMALGVTLAGSLLAGCGGDEDGSSAEGGSSSSDGKVVAVKVGVGPYYDFTLFQVAKELGLDREIGIDLNISNFPELPLQQLRRGDIDIGYSAPTAGFPAYENFSGYRDFLLTNQFKGFVIVGRPGEVKPYSEYAAASDDAEAAKRDFVQNELRGRSFCIVKSLQIAALSGMLELGGVTTKEIKVVDFADQAKAANAFIRGECDFYTGAVPQEARLLYSEDFEGQFIAAAPHEAFGPGEAGVLFFSTFATSAEWLAANRETAKKLVAMWFRATRYLKEQPERATPVVAEAVKETTGGLFDEATTERILTELLVFPTLEEAGELYFASDSATYYSKSVGQLFENAQKEGQVPATLDVDRFQAVEDMYREVSEDQALLDYVNAPLK